MDAKRNYKWWWCKKKKIWILQINDTAERSSMKTEKNQQQKISLEQKRALYIISILQNAVMDMPAASALVSQLIWILAFGAWFNVAFYVTK